VGDVVFAIGNPFGWAVGGTEPTMTVGVVSAVNRSIEAGEKGRTYLGLLQTDAAINPGNSGGPLVDLDGEIIGINVAIFSTTGGYQGIGFAIPGNTAQAILDDLIEGRKVLYGWLGVHVQDLNEELAEHFGLDFLDGVIVARVLEDSPAEGGGLKDGDVITEMDRLKVRNVKDLLKRVGLTPVGDVVAFKVIREGKIINVKVKIGERPEDSDGGVGPAESWRGLKVEGLTPERVKELELDSDKGVTVISIDEDSPAEEAGFRLGDVILAIQRKPITSVEDFKAVTERVRGNALIQTGRGFVILKPEE